MVCPYYSEVSRLVREAFAEYKRVDKDADRDTFADFVDGVTGDELYRFVERRADLWPLGEALARVQLAISLHRALGASIVSLAALLPEPEESKP